MKAEKSKSRKAHSAQIGFSYRKTKEDLALEEQSRVMKECTFRPNITSSLTKSNLSLTQRLENLSQPKSQVHSTTEQDCIKQMSTSSSSYLVNSSSKTANTMKSTSSLSATKSKSTQILRPRTQQEPLYKRALKIQKEREEEKNRKVRESLDEYSFRPQISPTSQRLASKRQSESSLQNKPSSQSKNFSLSTNQCSSHTDIFKDTTVAFSRRSLESSKLEVKTSKMPCSPISDPHTNPSFKPLIDCHSDVLVKAKIGKESLDQKINRWGKKEIIKREINQSKLKEKTYIQYSFSPNIDIISKHLARKSSVQELSSPRKLKPKEEEQLTFRPSLHKSPRFFNVLSHYAQSQDTSSAISLATARKQEKLRLLRNINEYNEIKDCTFSPEFVKRIPTRRHVEVEGTDRFMELVEMSNKKKSCKKNKYIHAS